MPATVERFRIGPDALQRRAERGGDVFDLIAHETGQHVNGEFVRRCIVAQGYDTVTVDDGEGGGVVVQFSTTLRRCAPGSHAIKAGGPPGA